MAPRINPEDARARLIKRSDMVACKVAFIDCKMPGSDPASPSRATKW